MNEFKTESQADELRILKHTEMIRREKRMYWNKKLDELLAGAVFVGAITIVVFLIFALA